jgi:putative salt-induced outer membrane protein YdiY
MNSRTLIVGSVLLFFAAPLLARDKTDVLVMKNGDRMSCEVKGLEAGILKVSFDYIDGTTSVDWSKVARVESKQLFLVKTEDGSVYTGTLNTLTTSSGRPVKIEVAESPAQGVKIDQPQIISLTPTSENFWQRFNGEISSGVTYSKGNQSTVYSLGSETAYVRERWGIRANFDSNLSSNNGATASARNELTVISTRLMPWKNWFYASMTDFLQSSVQGISLQSSLGGGVGRYLKNTNRASISLIGGPAWQNTNYQQSSAPVSGHNLAAAWVYADAKLFKFSKTNLNLTAGLMPAISDPGRIRLNANASYYVKLFSDLKWNISFYANWDNRPPTGFSSNDYGTSSGLSWTFGLK